MTQASPTVLVALTPLEAAAATLGLTEALRDYSRQALREPEAITPEQATGIMATADAVDAIANALGKVDIGILGEVAAKAIPMEATIRSNFSVAAMFSETLALALGDRLR